MSHANLGALQATLQVEFKEPDLLQQSLTHRSYLNEHPSFRLGHNERLEFLGDAVIELVVTDFLYRHYPNPEGELTNWRAALVNAEMLAHLAETLHLDRYLLLSKGEAKDGSSKARRYILANTFEAVVGAIYLDRGLPTARRFIQRVVTSQLGEVLSSGKNRDPKSAFQERSQATQGTTPRYEVLAESGPDHSKHFTVGVYLGQHLVAKGTGSSKQEAQVAAARAGLKAKGW